MNSFYVTLDSVASKNVYSSNGPGCFKNILPKSIDVSDNWEVALVELTFPRTFHNVRENACIAWLFVDGEIKRKYVLHPLYYINVDRILAHMTYHFLGYYEFDVKDGRVFCQAKKENVGILMSKTLSLMLGFALQAERQDNNSHAYFEHNIDLGITPRVRVLSNVVSQQIVGDKFLPLLREFVVEPQTFVYGSTSYVRFDSPIYAPVAINKLDTVSIYLTDDNDVQCSFDSGATTALLHFRRCEEK